MKRNTTAEAEAAATERVMATKVVAAASTSTGEGALSLPLALALAAAALLRRQRQRVTARTVTLSAEVKNADAAARGKATLLVRADIFEARAARQQRIFRIARQAGPVGATLPLPAIPDPAAAMPEPAVASSIRRTSAAKARGSMSIPTHGSMRLHHDSSWR